MSSSNLLLSTSSSHSNLNSQLTTPIQSQRSDSNFNPTILQTQLPHSSSSNSIVSLHRPSLSSFHHDTHTTYPADAEFYDIIAEIGVGAFATVYKAVIRPDPTNPASMQHKDEEVAVKVIDLDQFSTNWDEVRREIQIMSALHHPNIVRILTSFVSGQDLWIIMPLLQAGSTAAIMKQISPNGFKDEALIATILWYTLQALDYLHSASSIHRDLKAGNILIGQDGSVELADFGVASSLMEGGDRKRNRQTFTGTPCWMAPEVMEHTSGYDSKADIWSFGIVAMELAFGRAPYAKFQPMKVMLMTLQEPPPTCEIYKDNSYTFSKHFHALIQKCLNKDPSKRPTAKKLLDHKFFKQRKDNAYIVEKIINKLPKPAPIDPATIHRIHVCREKSLIDAQKIEKAKPVSVGSWSFDNEEYEKFKAKAATEGEERESVNPNLGANLSNRNDFNNDEKVDDHYTASTRNPHHERYFAAIPGQQGLIGVPLETIAALRNQVEKWPSGSENGSTTLEVSGSEEGQRQKSQRSLVSSQFGASNEQLNSQISKLNQTHQMSNQQGRFMVSDENEEEDENEETESTSQQQNNKNNKKNNNNIHQTSSETSHDQDYDHDAKITQNVQTSKLYQIDQTASKIGRFAITDE